MDVSADNVFYSQSLSLIFPWYSRAPAGPLCSMKPALPDNLTTIMVGCSYSFFSFSIIFVCLFFSFHYQYKFLFEAFC